MKIYVGRAGHMVSRSPCWKEVWRWRRRWIHRGGSGMVEVEACSRTVSLSVYMEN